MVGGRAGARQAGEARAVILLLILLACGPWQTCALAYIVGVCYIVRHATR
jgi:hypothetical protein